ncbi:serine/threonine-protein kinase KIN2 [Nowakowskiella sp. JEL0078]|nr:serine/threonine-protein kinase KIN2 [Nowakowskiella sp. JEL0078]
MKELYKKIASGTYTIPDYLMPDSRHLISRLITVDPKKRATLKEVMQHQWVNQGYSTSPSSYLPERPIIFSEDLSKEIVGRLITFGYSEEEIYKAFGENIDLNQPNPIRSQYFLLVEMLQREEAKLRNKQQKNFLHGSSDISSQNSSSTFLNSAISQSHNELFSKHDMENLSLSPTLSNLSSRNLNSDIPLSVEIESLDQLKKRSPGKSSLTSRPYFSSVQSLMNQNRRASSPDGTPAPALKISKIPPEVSHNQSSKGNQPSLHINISAKAPNLLDIVNENTHRGIKDGIYLKIINLMNFPEKMKQEIQNTQICIKDPPISVQKQELEFIENKHAELSTQSATILRNQAELKSSNSRRFSIPGLQSKNTTNNNTTNPSKTSPINIREELRFVSGWFLNVSTTSSRPPYEIIDEVLRVLIENKVRYEFDQESGYTVTCNVDVEVVLTNDNTPQTSNANSEIPNYITIKKNTEMNNKSHSFGSLEDPEGHILNESTPKRTQPKTGLIFQIEVCKVPRMTGLYGLHFKRLSGG